ncbi:MAG: PilZ domain-containing protein [Planctomycetes bacterium]|nr:PilZ domain-containing protein [Planctomycetota bacterium]MCC7395654.1 PilZ domain-containing protein [Planctomycetota bacterium]
MKDDDRRRAPRVSVAAVASLETLGALNANNQALCTVRDVSRSGIGLQTGQPPIAGQAVVLRLALDDVIHELKTRATRVLRRGDSNFYDIGLDWSTCSPAQLKFLDDVLAAIEGHPLDEA